MPPDRWFAVGTADASADDAGRRAADAALINDDAKLLIVFCSPTANLPDLIGQIGCTTAGEITRDGPGRHRLHRLALTVSQQPARIQLARRADPCAEGHQASP